MMNDILLSSIPVHELESLIEKSVCRAIQSKQTVTTDKALYVSIKTAAAMIGVSHVTVYDYIKVGRLVKYKIGRTTRLLKSEVLSIVQPE